MSRYDPDRMSVEQLYQYCDHRAIPVEEPPSLSQPKLLAIYEKDIREIVRKHIAQDGKPGAPGAAFIMQTRSVPASILLGCRVDVKIIDQRQLPTGVQEFRVNPLMGTGEVWVTEEQMNTVETVVERDDFIKGKIVVAKTDKHRKAASDLMKERWRKYREAKKAKLAAEAQVAV